MDRTAGKESGHHAIPQSGGTLLAAMLGTACIVLFASEAVAQCTARDVVQNHLALRTTRSANTSPTPVKSAFAVPVWRTITVGTFANSFALLNALDAAGCGIGSLAGEILARPAFDVATTKTSVELVAVSVAELGFRTDTAPLADIYARARQLGFGLAPAEVAPQLRLQFFDQAMGEFHHWHGADQDVEWRACHFNRGERRSGIGPDRPGWPRRRSNTRGFPLPVRAVRSSRPGRRRSAGATRPQRSAIAECLKPNASGRIRSASWERTSSHHCPRGALPMRPPTRHPACSGPAPTA